MASGNLLIAWGGGLLILDLLPEGQTPGEGMAYHIATGTAGWIDASLLGSRVEAHGYNGRAFDHPEPDGDKEYFVRVWGRHVSGAKILRVQETGIVSDVAYPGIEVLWQTV